MGILVALNYSFCVVKRAVGATLAETSKTSAAKD